jgi:hypothetical protein
VRQGVEIDCGRKASAAQALGDGCFGAGLVLAIGFFNVNLIVGSFESLDFVAPLCAGHGRRHGLPHEKGPEQRLELVHTLMRNREHGACRAVDIAYIARAEEPDRLDETHRLIGRNGKPMRPQEAREFDEGLDWPGQGVHAASLGRMAARRGAT